MVSCNLIHSDVVLLCKLLQEMWYPNLNTAVIVIHDLHEDLSRQVIEILHPSFNIAIKRAY